MGLVGDLDLDLNGTLLKPPTSISSAEDSPANGKLITVILPFVALFIGLWFLLHRIPFGEYFPYFWDGAGMILGLNPGSLTLPSFGDGSYSVYALRKYLYSLPVQYSIQFTGNMIDGVLFYNLALFFVMCFVGSMSLHRRGYLGAAPLFLAGMVSIPYVHKYIGMANPTIQSMLLWFLVMLTYDSPKKGNPHLLGFLFGLLVLTDFPKWLLVSIPVIALTELVCCREVKRLVVVFSWIAGLLLVATAFLPGFFHNNFILTLGLDGASIEPLRIGLSQNFLIFLYELGGLVPLVFILLCWKKYPKHFNWRFPGVIVPLAIVVVFSCVLWPRNARMFAVVVPWIIYVASGWVLALWRTRQNNLCLPMIGSFVMIIMILVHSLRAGECYTQMTGVRAMAEITENVVGQKEVVGTYFPNNFALAGRGRTFVSMVAYMGDSFKYIITHDFLDYTIIDEQFMSGSSNLSYTWSREWWRGVCGSKEALLWVPAPFYSSKWYLVESNYVDGQLIFMLRRAAEIVNPCWRLRKF